MSRIYYEPGDVVYYPKTDRCSGKTITVCDRYKVKYPSGKRYTRYLYSDLIETMVQDMHERVQDDYDNVVCVWGAEGVGKSNLAYQIAKTYNPDFDMEKSYAYSLDMLLSKIHDMDCDDGAVWWMDEATNIAGNRDWMKQDNKAFISMLEMFRSRHWTLILCIPDISRLDIYLRENRVRYELHCEKLSWEHAGEMKRGYFELKINEPRSSSGYRETITVGFGRFGRIPPEEQEKYHRIKGDTQDSKLDELYEARNKKSIIKEQGAMIRKLYLQMYEDGKTISEICEITGKAYNTIKQDLCKARKERGDTE